MGLAVARYDFYLYSPTATQGHAAHMRLSIWGGGFGGHASSVPLPETPKDWLELDCLRKFSVWDLDQGPGAAAMGGFGVGAGFSGVLIDAFNNAGKPLFRNQLITGFGTSAGAGALAGAGRWSFKKTTVPLHGAQA
jgi:hypothetical protein